jgi:lipoprotein signal peptidase
MARAAAALSLTAALVATADLTHKAIALADPGSTIVPHERSLPYALGVVAVSALWAVAILLTRSLSIAIAGGLFLGGAAGNVASLALWPSVDGVPNPLLAGDLAFNVADVAVAVGLALVLTTAALFAGRNRARLHERVRI